MGKLLFFQLALDPKKMTMDEINEGIFQANQRLKDYPFDESAQRMIRRERRKLLDEQNRRGRAHLKKMLKIEEPTNKRRR